jgi:hypothetical protein
MSPEPETGYMVAPKDARGCEGALSVRYRPWPLLLACAIPLIFANGSAFGETWHCAIKDALGLPQIDSFRVDGRILKELTSDKIWHEIDRSLGKEEFAGDQFTILHNDKYSLIANSNYAGPDSTQTIEIYVRTIIIEKLRGNVIINSMLTHLPAPNEIETNYGTCTVDNE